MGDESDGPAAPVAARLEPTLAVGVGESMLYLAYYLTDSASLT